MKENLMIRFMKYDIVQFMPDIGHYSSLIICKEEMDNTDAFGNAHSNVVRTACGLLSFFGGSERHEYWEHI